MGVMIPPIVLSLVRIMWLSCLHKNLWIVCMRHRRINGADMTKWPIVCCSIWTAHIWITVQCLLTFTQGHSVTHPSLCTALLQTWVKIKRQERDSKEARHTQYIQKNVS